MLEVSVNWWFLDPTKYEITLRKDSNEDIFSFFHLMEFFACSLDKNQSLIPFAKELLKVKKIEGSKKGRERFDTKDLQEFTKNMKPPEGKIEWYAFKLTPLDLCQCMVFLFSEVDIHEHAGLGDPRVLLLQKLERKFAEENK